MNHPNEITEKDWIDAKNAEEFDALRDNPPPVLDACCGSRMMWFDKQDERALFVDRRRERIEMKPDKGYPSGCKIVVDPDMQLDFTNLPFRDNTFALVVFDPPHIQREEARGALTFKYGCLNGDWRQMLRDGFAECFRVLRPEGVLIFKWAETEVAVKDILALTNERPLFGHKSGKSANTHWVTFMKPAKVGAGDTAVQGDMLLPANDRVEGRGAASSRRVPSHDGLCGNGTEVGSGGTAKG